MTQKSKGSKQEIWIKNGIVVTQDNSRSVLRSNIRIVGNRIVSIGKAPASRQIARTKIIDANGLAILPGFIQAHTHLCQTLFRNMADDLELLDWLSKRIWVLEGAHTKETLFISALLGIHELLSSGTTCILDMGTVRHTDEIAKAVIKTGIRANIGKCLMDNPKTTPINLREPTEVALKGAIDIFNRYHKTHDDRIRVSYAPRFVISCTEKLLREVLTLAISGDTLVHTHASENLKEIQLVKKLVGYENIEYLHELGLTSEKLVLAHCIWLKPKEQKILKRTKTKVVHCPSANMKLASGYAHLPEMRKMGITVALGADGAPCNNNLNIFEEMRLAALMHKPASGPRAMKAQEVLDMATREGAKTLSWFDQIGSLEVGKKADIIALDLRQVENLAPVTVWCDKKIDKDALASSIVYSSRPEHVKFTMVNGKVLYKNGRLIKFPVSKENLIKSALQAQAQLIKTTKIY